VSDNFIALLGGWHGGNSPEEKTIPWIISGPGVAVGKTLSNPIETYDTAPTIAYLLSLQVPVNAG